MSKIESNGAEVAKGILTMLDDKLDQPKRFQPNLGKALVHFSHRRQLIKMTVEAKGNFVMEFEVSMNEFRRDPEQAFHSVMKAFNDTHMAGLMRRHEERHTLDKVMKELH